MIYVVALALHAHAALARCGPPVSHAATAVASDDARSIPAGHDGRRGLVAATLSIVVDWAVVRAIYGDRFAGHARLAHPIRPRRDDQSGTDNR